MNNPIPIDEFEKMVASNNWIHEQTVEICETGCGLFDNEWRTQVLGFVNKHSKLVEHNIEIVYFEVFSFFEGDMDSLSIGDDSQPECWNAQDVYVVDENGQPLDAHDLGHDYLPEEFSELDYSLARKQIESIYNKQKH